MLTRLVHLAARVRAMFRPAPLDRDLDAEFAAHVAMLADEHIRAARSASPGAMPRGWRWEASRSFATRTARREAFPRSKR